MPFFHFQTPPELPKEREKKETKQRRKKKGSAVQTGNQTQVFLHRGKKEGESPKPGTSFPDWSGEGPRLSHSLSAAHPGVFGSV